MSQYTSDIVRGYAVENSFTPEMPDTNLHEIRSRAAGMFLWATLAWENFKDGVGSWTKALVKQKLSELQQLPPGLDSLYYSLLMKVDQRLHVEIFELLIWLVTAQRPLYVAKLSIYLALRTRPQRSKDTDVKLSLKTFIKRALPHLVRVEEDGYVALVHQSFKDLLLQIKYLQFQGSQVSNKFFIDITQANYYAAGDCLTYLALDDIGIIYEDFEINLEKAVEQFPFFEYALLNWAAHLHQVEDSDDV